ncbi:globin domain-containing protein [Flavisphingomonas formosensis]|uniref:globin domain-containing protein n=1 Tax=Flavisphingomonas formosensis TaxID=861534 RepID=UPI0012FAF6AE|nr:globin [Sphingomonas formosensis]
MPITPFDRAGGGATLARLADRFYDRIEQDARFAPLRALHESDLDPVRRSLAAYLAAWMGGPADWFEQARTPCILSLHRRLAISPETAGLWVEAMEHALSAEAAIDAELGAEMIARLRAMAGAMVNRPATVPA